MNAKSQESRAVSGPFVEGRLLTSESESRHDIVNPSNGEICLAIPKGCDSDVKRAVASSRSAFDDGRWSEPNPSFRAKTLRRFADLIAGQSSALDVLDAREMGKPVAELAFNAASAADLMRFYAEAIDKI